jgi:Big-like domain-containing protein
MTSMEPSDIHRAPQSWMHGIVLPLCAAGAIGLVGAACQASYPLSPSTPSPAALQIHVPSALGPVPVVSGFALFAYVLNSEGAYEDVTMRASWSTSDPSVISRAATTSTIGPMPFVAMSVGTAVITAQYQGFSTSVTIATFRRDRPAFPTLMVTGGDARLLRSSAPATATLQQSATESQTVTTLVSWSSSDGTVATVGSDGMVRAMGPGTTLITASFNGLSASYLLSVSPAR